MRYILFFAALLLAACQKKQEPTEPPEIPTFKASSQQLQAASGPMYSGLKDMLDLSNVTSTKGKENVVIYMAGFKNDPNKIYAASTKGEVLYVKRGNIVGLLKAGEAIRIEGQEVRDMGAKEYNAFFTQYLEPVEPIEPDPALAGFCQRRPGQSFGDCYKKTSDDFCSSFISCIALNTQPTIHIMIAVACSCMATIKKFEAPLKNLFPDSLKIDTLNKPELNIEL